MKLYFFTNPRVTGTAKATANKIIETLTQAGVFVSSNLYHENLYQFSSQDLEKISQSGEFMLEKMDGLIIDGTNQTGESGYMVALALAHKKPILYLLEKGQIIEPHLKGLRADKQIGKLLIITFFQPGNVVKPLSEFIQAIETSERGELPNIKFTLRITTAIERYLHWKTHNTAVSKADFLRAQIEELMKKDADYQKYLRHRSD